VTEAVGPTTWCLGADAFERSTGREVRFLALATMIASGGSGHVYPSTTNPAVATGDGIAMAARAGAAIGNMEFMQFHPTSFYAAAAPFLPEMELSAEPNRAPVFLISEAVRGEGAVLLDGSGSRFMDDYDVRGELAPRDVVARAIAAQCKARQEPCAFLDISHKPAADVLNHFPNIAAHCAAHGLDITRHPIPVTPAMHYTCGGVCTDQHAATNLKGLFACGEAAYTGLHGANRLASNSLLEGLVFGRGAAAAATAHAAAAAASPRVEVLYRAAACREARHLYIDKEAGHQASASSAREAKTMATLVSLRTQTQDAMWEHAGIVRTTASLLSALQRVRELGAAAAELPLKGCSPSLAFAWYEVANLLTVAELVVISALQRKESRGLHYTLDYPDKVESERRPTLIHNTLPAATVLNAVHAKRINRSALLSSKSKSLAKPAPAALPILEARIKASADKGLVPK
jgi:L-aspartate oxidase